jgi:hypothetical protein
MMQLVKIFQKLEQRYLCFEKTNWFCSSQDLFVFLDLILYDRQHVFGLKSGRISFLLFIDKLICFHIALKLY